MIVKDEFVKWTKTWSPARIAALRGAKANGSIAIVMKHSYRASQSLLIRVCTASFSLNSFNSSVRSQPFGQLCGTLTKAVFFCFVLLCCYSALQCKAVQTLASFHLTEYEVTEWAADLNLVLLEYLGGGAEGVHNTTFFVFNQFRPFSIPLI